MTLLRRAVLASALTIALTVAVDSQPALARTAPATRHHLVHLSHAQAKRMLIRAARHHHLNPNFVLAVSYWESGWRQDAVSRTGAVGMMQIEPYTAAWAGPALLGRRVNIDNPQDNAELGAALLRTYLDQLHDPKLTLAAYYQGMQAVRRHGIYPSSRSYVNGIWRLRNLFQAGRIPA